MKQKKLFLTLLFGVTAIAMLLTFQATVGTASAVFTPSELLLKNGEITRVRVAGRVTAEPISYNLEPHIELRFRVSDREEAGAVSLPVVYRNLKPDMFGSGRDVLIDGDYRDGVLVASSLLTQCPSKYEPPSPSEQ
jgi:cytochrome c-type biogenesis protein CcmE